MVLPDPEPLMWTEDKLPTAEMMTGKKMSLRARLAKNIVPLVTINDLLDFLQMTGIDIKKLYHYEICDWLWREMWQKIPRTSVSYDYPARYARKSSTKCSPLLNTLGKPFR